jgi:hypothetical protein
MFESLTHWFEVELTFESLTHWFEAEWSIGRLKRAGIFPHIVKACLCFSLFFTFPVMVFPVSALLERQLSADGRTLSYVCTIPLVVILLLNSGMFDGGRRICRSF